MEEELAVVLLYDGFKERFVGLKTKILGEVNETRTIIGKDYQWVRPAAERSSKREVHDQHSYKWNSPSAQNVDWSVGEEEETKAEKIMPEDSNGHDDEEQGNRWKKTLVSFGPAYRHLESDMWNQIKQDAWEHILSKTSNDEGYVRTEQIYFQAVEKLKRKAKALYGYVVNDDDDDNEFVWLMIKDGCLLLQVALLVLAGNLKQVPHIAERTFGQNKGLIGDAMSSMFIPGNQIPIVILKELMKQSFFQNLIINGRWEQPLDLERWALFELLLVPMLDPRQGSIFIQTASLSDYKLYGRHMGNSWMVLWTSGVMGFMKSVCLLWKEKVSARRIWFKRVATSEKAHDLLHGLWLLMTGSEKDDDIEDVDDDGNGSSAQHYQEVFPTVPCATELLAQEVIFVHREATRIRELAFKKFFFSSFLLLPRITINSRTMMLLCNLIYYEASPKSSVSKSRRKVCAYLQLMRELIRSADDAKLLVTNGVILVDHSQEGEVHKFLEKLPIPRTQTKDGHINKVRDKLSNYTRPRVFKKMGEILSFVILLSVIQTVYTALSFHKG